MSCDTIRPLIGPFRDGELSLSERRTVAEHVQTCLACSALLEADQGLAHHIAEGAAMTVPPGLESRIKAALDLEDRDAPVVKAKPAARPFSIVARPWAQAAAVMFACVLSATGGYQLANVAARSGDLQREVLQAHVRSLLQDNPIQVASSDSHTVRPWFAGRIDIAPNVADHAAQGFPLIGGRMDTIGDTRVGVVVYKRNAHWVNIYMWPSNNAPDSPPQPASRSGYNLLSWTHGGITHYAVSDLNMSELRQLQALM